MNNFQSPLTAFLPSNAGNDDSSKTLLDLISVHNSGSVTNEHKESDSPKTLLDFINAHTLQSKKDEADASSVDDLASQHLNLNTVKEKESDNLISLKIVDRKSENECDTLEEYTKLFLNSKASNIFQYLKRKPCASFPKSGSEKKTEETDLDNIHKKMLHCYISESNESESCKIDLTAALKSKLRQNLLTTQVRNSNEVKGSSFSDCLRECSIDFLFFDMGVIEKDVLYSSSTLSSFGRVVCKKWNRPLLPKKYRKLENVRPYNIAKSFKFDTPSPDDAILKTRKRNNSVNES